MTWSAPAAAASCALRGLLTVVITVASAQRASWIAALPTAPAPPCTSTVCPVSEPAPSRSGSDSATVRQRCAVRNGMPSDAPELEGRVGAQQHHLPRRDDGLLGGGAPRPLVGGLPDPHPLADQHRVDALADRLDRARAVLVRGSARPARRRCRRWRRCGSSSRSGSRPRRRPAPGPRRGRARAPPARPAAGPRGRRSRGR